LSSGAAALLIAAGPWVAAPHCAPDDALARTREVYAALSSYADSGSIIAEYGVSGRDQHTFTSSFVRAPRRFFLDFRKAGGDRFVIWGDPDAFHTWWKATGVQTDFPNPNNIPALSTTTANTADVVGKIPTLLYSKAQIPGDFTNFRDVVADTDTVDGRRCNRFTGTTRDVYGGTGREVNARKMTVWIDADSSLIRKIIEEWTPLPGQVHRNTTTYQPQANPTLEESRFRFVAPK